MAIEVVEWNSYNGRRYGRPWAAVVTYDAAGRPSYDFKRGSYQGSDAGGTLFVNAKPGDVVAYGQKDSRGNGGTNTIAIVQSDGSVSDTTKAAAFRHYQDQKNKPPPPPQAVAAAVTAPTPPVPPASAAPSSGEAASSTSSGGGTGASKAGSGRSSAG